MKFKTLKEIRLNARGLRLAQESDTNISYEAQAGSEDFTDANVAISVSPEESTRSEEGVVFKSDANARTISRAEYVRLPSELKNSAFDGMTMAVSEFLRRPVIVLAGNIANTDAPTTFPPITLFEALTNASIAEKLKGVFSFRATTVITLQINATRFQQGIYILAFMPMGGLRYDTTQGSNWYKIHRFSKSSITQLFHVKFDVGCDTEVQIRIPYSSATAAYPISSTVPQSRLGVPGVWFLYPYVPLASVSGATTASFTVWSHFEDVELLGNTVPQMGWEAQSGKSSRKGKDLLQKEVDSDRPISNALRMSALVSDSLSKIPLLSSIATPLTWVLEAGANAAFYWGWSRPLVTKDQMRVVREPAPYMGNADGADNAAPLSLSVNNHVSVLPGFGGTDIDEMSIDFLKGKFSWFASFDWTTAQVPNTQLIKKDMAPALTFTIISSGGINMTAHTVISYLSTLYKLWRGGLIVRLKIAKTEFHTGRLLISFNPYDAISGSNTNVTLTTSAFTHREIWDIRENSEITLRIPYVSINPWQETYGVNHGSLTVLVLDNLIAPSTVPSTVSVQMEICGADDLAFSAPVLRAQRQIPCVPATLQMGWEAQIGDDGCEAGYTPIGGSVEQSRSLIHEETTIGEVSTSLRQLVKRGGVMHCETPSAGGPVAAEYYIPPNVIGTYIASAGSTVGYATVDPFSYIGMLYAQSRGGVRIKMLQLLKRDDIYYSYVSNALQTYTVEWWNEAATSTTVPVRRGVEQLAMHYTDAQIVSVQVPQYSMLINNIVGGNTMTIGSPLVSTDPQTNRANVVISHYPSDLDDAQYVNFWRSGADDFGFGDFVSVPCITSYIEAPG
jgi:hypothetical protein